MNITWNYDAPSGDEKSIEVTFTCDTPSFSHVRGVNAVFDSSDNYDADATEVRVSEVANGVKHKISLGVITPPAE